MKKIMSFVLVLSLLISNRFIVYGETDAQAVKPPNVEATAAILMDFSTGRVLWEKNAHEPMAMASTTKIMTAILTIESRSLDEIVKISQNAAIAPPVKMYLQKGEEISLRALMYALMLQSSNDAAVAIAEYVGGTVENFCEMMTKKARKLGAKNTVFKTPNGLDAGDHHSTAYDLALISRYALDNKDFNEIINTNKITFTSSRKQYNIYNKNRLLNEFKGANGVKTGFTTKAGHCFVGSAKQGNMQLISVVLASGWGHKGKEQKWVDTKRILKYGFENYRYTEVLADHSSGGKIPVIRSKEPSVDTYIKGQLVVPLSKKEKEQLQIVKILPESIKAPVEKDIPVGKAQVIINGCVYHEVDILTEDSVERFDIKTCGEKVLENFVNLGTRVNVDIQFPDLIKE